jgi:hypothetical protein
VRAHMNMHTYARTHAELSPACLLFSPDYEQMKTKSKPVIFYPCSWLLLLPSVWLACVSCFLRMALESLQLPKVSVTPGQGEHLGLLATPCHMDTSPAGVRQCDPCCLHQCPCGITGQRAQGLHSDTWNIHCWELQ